jgi:hypothetical protein
MFGDDGLPTAAFLADLNRWVYGPITSTGTLGAYVVVSTYPYSSVPTAPTIGRVVYFKANHSSPSGGSTLKLDTLAAAPILTFDGQAIGEAQIKSGMLLSAVFDGTSWIVPVPLEQGVVTFTSSRSFDSSFIEKPAYNTTVPFATLTISLNKPAGAVWDVIDLHLIGTMTSNGVTAGMTAAITFDDGPSVNASVSSANGCNNLGQRFDINADNDSIACPWSATFEMPPAYQSVNSVQFKAVLTIIGSPGFTSLPQRQYFRGVAKYIRP